MVSAMSVPVVSSFWCPLPLLEVLLIALQHRQGKANITVCREERNNARQPLLSLSLMQEREVRTNSACLSHSDHNCQFEKGRKESYFLQAEH